MTVLRARVRRSLDTTFLVHVATILFSAVIATGTAVLLDGHIGDGPHDAIRRGIVAEGLLGIGHEAWLRLGLCAGAVIVLEALSSPFLAMAWAIAITDGVGARSAISRAPSLYLRAVVARLAAFASAIPPLLLAAAIPFSVHLAIARMGNARAHDLGVLVGSVPFLVLVLAAITFADFVDVALVVDEPRPTEAWLLGLRALRPGAVLESVGFRVARFCVGATAAALAAAAPEPVVLAGIFFVLAQLLLLFATLLRGVWLARAVARVEAVR